MEITIERTVNGYTCQYGEEVEEGKWRDYTVCFEDQDEDGGEVECFARLLWFLTEHFGMVGSKHDKHRIRIFTEGEEC